MTTIKRIATGQLMVQATDDQMRRVFAAPSELELCKKLPDVPFLGVYGTKIYSRGGGWWQIYGYAADGSDTEHVVTKLQE